MEKENNKSWYVVKVHSGFEQAIKGAILQTIESLKLEDQIAEIIIPTENKIKIKDGKRVEKKERIYPGYILVNMVVNDETWYAINNIEHISGFLGSRSHVESLSQEEVDVIKERMKSSVRAKQTDYNVGDTIKIIEGPFANVDGKISEMDEDKGQATVSISMFGRETPVKLDLFQIRPI